MPWFCPWATPCFECILQGAHSRDARADCFLWQEWLHFWICETAFLQTWQDMAFHSQHLAKGGEAFRASQDHSVYVQPPWIFFAGNGARSPEAKSSAKPPEPAQPPRTAYLLVLVSFFLWNALAAVTGHQQLHLRLLFNKAVPGVRCDYCWNNTAQSEKHLLWLEELQWCWARASCVKFLGCRSWRSWWNLGKLDPGWQKWCSAGWLHLPSFGIHTGGDCCMEEKESTKEKK